MPTQIITVPGPNGMPIQKEVEIPEPQTQTKVEQKPTTIASDGVTMNGATPEYHPNNIYDDNAEPTPQESAAQGNAPVAQNVTTPTAAPTTTAPSTPISALQSTINTGKANAGNGQNLKKAGVNTQSQFEGYRDADAATRVFDKVYNDSLQKGIARSLLDNYKPAPEPTDPYDEQKRLQNRKTAILLGDVIRTIMGGVASNNNSSMPIVDSAAAINKLDERTQGLHDLYLKQLESKKERDDKFNSEYNTALKADREAALKRATEAMEAYKTKTADRNQETVEWYDEQGRKHTTKGSSASGKTGKKGTIHFGGVDYDAPESVVAGARQIAMDVINSNPQLKNNIIAQYLRDTNPDLARKNNSEMQDILEEKGRNGTLQQSYLDWLKSDQKDAYLDNLLYANPEIYENILGSRVSSYLNGEGQGRDNFRSTKHYTPYYMENFSGQFIPGHIVVSETDQVDASGNTIPKGTRFVVDADGMPVQYKEGARWEDQWGDKWIIINGKKEPQKENPFD